MVFETQVAAPTPQALQVLLAKKNPELQVNTIDPRQLTALAGHPTQVPLTALNPGLQLVAYYAL